MWEFILNAPFERKFPQIAVGFCCAPEKMHTILDVRDSIKIDLNGILFRGVAGMEEEHDLRLWAALEKARPWLTANPVLEKKISITSCLHKP